MGKETSLVGLAKGTNKKPIAKKPEAKVVEKKLTPQEERDIKAKQKVKELLEDVDLVPKELKEAEYVVKVIEPPKGIEWLEEQVNLLTEENEQLKNDYSKLFEQYQQKSGGGNLLSETVNQNILLMFTELQNNLLGNNPERHSWDQVNVKYLLNQFVQLFPTVVERYQKF